MLASCKMVQKQFEAFPTSLWHFFQVQNRILLHIVLLKCPHVQIAFLKFSSCDNQVLLGCIPILAVAVHLNLKSWKLVSNNIESTTILNACTKSPKTYWMPYIYIVWYMQSDDIQTSILIVKYARGDKYLCTCSRTLTFKLIFHKFVASKYFTNTQKKIKVIFDMKIIWHPYNR